MKDEADIRRQISRETGLSEREAAIYLKLLEEGQMAAGAEQPSALLEKGMAIVSGDGRRIIPVHPRLGVANQFRTWREAMVKEIGERRMRVDKLILELVPIYEAATEKSTAKEGR